MSRVASFLLGFLSWMFAGAAFALAAAGAMAHFTYWASASAAEAMEGRLPPEPLLAESEVVMSLIAGGALLLFLAVGCVAGADRRRCRV